MSKRLKVVAFGAALAATATLSGCSTTTDKNTPNSTTKNDAGQKNNTSQAAATKTTGATPVDGKCTTMKKPQAIVEPGDKNYQQTLSEKQTTWYLPTFPADLKLHEVSWLEYEEVDCSTVDTNKTLPKFPGVPMTQSAKLTQALAKVTDDGTLEKAAVVGLEPQWTKESFGLAHKELQTMRSIKIQDVKVQGKPAKMFDVDIAANVLQVEKSEKFTDVPYYGFIVDNGDHGTVILLRGYDEAEAKKIAEETDLKTGTVNIGKDWQKLPTEAANTFPTKPSWRLKYQKPEKVNEKPRSLTVNGNGAGQWATSLVSAAWRHPDSPAKLYVLGDRLAYRHGPAGAAEGFSLGAHFVTMHVDNGRQVEIAMFGVKDVKLPEFLKSVTDVKADDKRFKPVDKTLVPTAPAKPGKPGAPTSGATPSETSTSGEAHKPSESSTSTP